MYLDKSSENDEQKHLLMNPFEFTQLKSSLGVIDRDQNHSTGTKLAIAEFDIFLEMRVENDETQNVFDIMPTETPARAVMDFNQPYMDETMSMHTVGSDVNYVADNGEYSQAPDMYTPENRFEIQSNLSSFVPGGDGIFQEASFLVMDSDNSFNSLESLKSELNIRRTMARIKKLGDGSTQFMQSKGMKFTQLMH